MKTYISISLLSLGCILVLGCATGNPRSASEAPRAAISQSGIPAKQYLIGGGWDIDYAVPATGTAYWVEETTAQVIEMKSLNSGERFQVSIADPLEFETALGIPMRDMRFTLYFVSAPNERVPLLSDIPQIGHLFSAEGNAVGERTESEQR
jgi:hypothetical protein